MNNRLIAKPKSGADLFPIILVNGRLTHRQKTKEVGVIPKNLQAWSLPPCPLPCKSNLRSSSTQILWYYGSFWHSWKEKNKLWRWTCISPLSRVSITCHGWCMGGQQQQQSHGWYTWYNAMAQHPGLWWILGLNRSNTKCIVAIP